MSIYVIWRTDEDDFFVTKLDNLTPGWIAAQNGNPRPFVNAAARIEYPDLSQGEIQWLLDEGYEFVAAFVADSFELVA